MPLHIDEAWEYYTPDPEAEYGVYCHSGLPAIERLHDDSYQRRKERGGSDGFRYGKGNPDRFQGIMGRRKGRLVLTPPLLPLRPCKGCGEWFRPERWKSDRKHCSDRCYKRPGRPRELEDRVCAHVPCGKVFRPRESAQAYCSCECGGAQGAPPKPEEARLARFREMYEAGEPRGRIAEALGINARTVKKWRKLAGVTPRPSKAPAKLRGGISP